MSTPRRWKRTLGIALGVVVTLVLALAGTVQARFAMEAGKVYPAPAVAIADAMATADVALGRRIYEVRSGCIDCHGQDGAGKAIMEDPAMGSIHGANITPSALREWSDEEVARVIRYGIRRDGHTVKGMPAFDYEGMSKGDVAALVAYLRSMPPVDRPSHANSIGPVLKVLAVLGKAPFALAAKYIDPSKGFADKPPEGATVAFGQYLAGACTGCHGAEFRGGPIPGGAPDWPPAANARLGANPAYSEASFKAMLKTGVSPATGQKLRQPMPVHLLAQLDETEQTALWLYLSSLK